MSQVRLYRITIYYITQTRELQIIGRFFAGFIEKNPKKHFFYSRTIDFDKQT